MVRDNDDGEDLIEEEEPDYDRAYDERIDRELERMANHEDKTTRA